MSVYAGQGPLPEVGPLFGPYAEPSAGNVEFVPNVGVKTPKGLKPLRAGIDSERCRRTCICGLFDDMGAIAKPSTLLPRLNQHRCDDRDDPRAKQDPSDRDDNAGKSEAVLLTGTL